jgi:hypothetical protein
MPKSGRRYITSSKPALWGGGSSEVASTIAPPVKYRAEENTYTEVGGKKLYKRGGTLATGVVKKRFTPEIKIVNVSENIWREGL